MTHYLIELALWLFLVFILCAFVACLVRRLFWFGDEQAAPAATTAAAAATAAATAGAASAASPRPLMKEPEKAVKPEPEPAPEPEVKPAPAPAPEPKEEAKPTTLEGRYEWAKAGKLPLYGLKKPEFGDPDDLEMISGIGPKINKLLHDLGVWYFAQIAFWKKKDIEAVNEKLKFKGRIEREEWVRQARLLARGKLSQFEKEYGTGGLKDASGQRRAGTRTRRATAKATAKKTAAKKGAGRKKG